MNKPKNLTLKEDHPKGNESKQVEKDEEWFEQVYSILEIFLSLLYLSPRERNIHHFKISHLIGSLYLYVYLCQVVRKEGESDHN